MSSVTRVAVVAGGLSPERSISFESASRVSYSLRALGFDSSVYDQDADLLDRLTADSVDVVFPLVHGGVGESGALQFALEHLGIPYVGSSPTACYVASDKFASRSLLSRDGIPVPRSVPVSFDSVRELLSASVLRDALESELGMPLVVKPLRGGSLLGLSLVTSTREVASALAHAYGYSSTVVVEEFLPGREMSVSVIEIAGEPMALPVVELHFSDEARFNYERRQSGEGSITAPASLPSDTADLLSATAIGCHRSLGLRDLSRTDFIVSESGAFHVLETTVSPGMAPYAAFPVSLAADGRSLAQVAAELIVGATKRGSS